MRSPDQFDDRDLDIAALHRATVPEPSRKLGSAGSRGGRSLKSYLLGGLVTIVLLLFGSVVWLAYKDMAPGDDAPPLIRAEAGPIKHEPDERGGLPVINEESVVVQALDEPDEPVRVERIVPRQTTAPRSTSDVIPEALASEAESEALVAEAETGATDSDTLDSLLAEIADGAGNPPALEPAAGSATPQVAAAPAATGTLTETVAALEPATAPAPTPPEAEPPAAVAVAPAAVPTPEPRVTPPTAAAPPAQSEPPLRAEPAEPVAVAALPTPALASDFNGAYRVQLLAVRDEAAAAGAWSGLQQRFPGVLGQLRSRVQRADVGDATFFRLQAGPFADRAGASATCEALQQRGTDCFVVEPTS